jgi:endonuclease YncB( thermonuclease family)
VKTQFLLALLFLAVFPVVTFAHPGELNGIVTDVIDGDTFKITAMNGTKYTVRMADVNASELGQVGYEEAKSSLSALINRKTIYLDVDNLYTWDNRGEGNRIVAIPYVDFNSTHFLNVNEAMFQGGYIEKKDYSNEFTPYSWDLYEPKNLVSDSPSDSYLFLLLLFVVFGVIVTIGVRRRFGK